MNKIRKELKQNLQVGYSNSKYYCYMQINFMKEISNPKYINVDLEIDGKEIKRDNIKEIAGNLRKLADELEAQSNYSVTDWVNEMLSEEEI